jgi:hypothetical protein
MKQLLEILITSKFKFFYYNKHFLLCIFFIIFLNNIYILYILFFLILSILIIKFNLHYNNLILFVSFVLYQFILETVSSRLLTNKIIKKQMKQISCFIKEALITINIGIVYLLYGLIISICYNIQHKYKNEK